jgi:hypothetical protein
MLQNLNLQILVVVDQFHDLFVQLAASLLLSLEQLPQLSILSLQLTIPFPLNSQHFLRLLILLLHPLPFAYQLLHFLSKHQNLLLRLLDLLQKELPFLSHNLIFILYGIFPLAVKRPTATADHLIEPLDRCHLLLIFLGLAFLPQFVVLVLEFLERD